MRPVLGFLLGVAVTFGPWLVKNWALADNPVYPLLYGVFGGRQWTAEKNAKWEWSHRVSLLVALGLQRPPEGVEYWPGQSQHAISGRQFLTNLIDVTAKADWQSPLVFGLAPLAFLLPRGRRAATWLWLLVAYLFMQWWLLTHRLDRFWVPLLPIAAVLAGAGATWSFSGIWRAFLAVVMTLVVFYNFSYSTTGLCGNYAYDAPLRDRTAPMDGTANPMALNWMNRNLPPSAHVLAVGAADLFHLDRPALYNTVFDDSIFEQLVRDRPPIDAARSLASHGVTHVYVSWAWVARYSEPGNYGFPESIVPALFRELVVAGVFERVALERFMPVHTVQVVGETVPAVELYHVVRELP